MEEGTLELSFKGPIGIWQVKRVGNGEKDFPTQYAGVQRERIQVGEYWQRVLMSGVQCACVNLIS